MNIFSVITLLGGLAFFLYGMNVMSDGLEKSANGKLDKSLKKVTHNRFLAMLFGAAMTIAVQSSSAVTVMLVGLVNAGILEFGQTIGVLMGSNIGTTLTAWILSLAGIESDVFWIQLLKPANFSLVFALIGIILMMVSKKQKHKNIGNILIGFAVLMFGMKLMSEAMEPLSEMPEFANLLTAFKNPILAVAFGAIFTGIIQSSAASVAILQALSMAGGVTYGMAIPIIMGQNIGTCVTALLSSIGVSRNAKKVAVVHLSFNIFGTLICLIPFCIGDMIFQWAFVDMEITPFMIAIVHSIFNVVTTMLLLPFAKQLEKLANKIIPELDQEEIQTIKLDDRILTVPALAVTKSFDLTVEMCKVSKKALSKAVDMIGSYNEKTETEIADMETRLDKLEDQLGTYMMKISKIGVSEEDSKKVAKILHTIDDFERIGDHAVNVVAVAKEIHDKKTNFSENAQKELAVLAEAVSEILELTSEAFRTSNLELAATVEPLDKVISNLILEVKSNHIKRLQKGTCTIELGFALNDLLNSYQRISDHCSNIAVAVIEAQHGTFDTHEYLHDIKELHKEEYIGKFKELSQKFSL